MSFLVCEVQYPLETNCFVTVVLSKSGLSRGFAFITAPDHECTELLKLNGIDFESQHLTTGRGHSYQLQIKRKLQLIIISHLLNKFQ